MFSIFRFFIIPAVLLLSAVISSCGGGGSGGETAMSPSEPPEQEMPVVVTPVGGEVTTPVDSEVATPIDIEPSEVGDRPELLLVALEDDPISGRPGETFTSVGVPAVSPSGQIAFTATGRSVENITSGGVSVPVTTFTTHVWYGNPESVRPILVSGDQIPGTDFVVEQVPSQETPVITEDGRVYQYVLLSDIVNPENNSSFLGGLLEYKNDVWQLIIVSRSTVDLNPTHAVAAGMPIPGVSAKGRASLVKHLVTPRGILVHATVRTEEFQGSSQTIIFEITGEGTRTFFEDLGDSQYSVRVSDECRATLDGSEAGIGSASDGTVFFDARIQGSGCDLDDGVLEVRSEGARILMQQGSIAPGYTLATVDEASLVRILDDGSALLFANINRSASFWKFLPVGEPVLIAIEGEDFGQSPTRVYLNSLSLDPLPPLSYDFQSIDLVDNDWVIIQSALSRGAALEDSYSAIVHGRSRQSQPYTSLAMLGRSTLTELDVPEFASGLDFAPRTVTDQGALYWFGTNLLYSRSADGTVSEIIDTSDRTSYIVSGSDRDISLAGNLKAVSSPASPLFARSNEIVLRTSIRTDSGSYQGIAVLRFE